MSLSRSALLAALLASATPLLAQPLPDLRPCLDSLRATRGGMRLTPDTWALLTDVTADTTVLQLLDAQPEVQLPVWDYMAVLTDDERVADGRAALARERAMIDRLVGERRVPAHILAAIWGIESNYGTGTGTFDVLRSLATLGCVGRRQTYFRGELLAALRIVERGDIPREAFRGSWAGAFGQTQFMPGSFERLAVDFDGDGRRDVIGSVADALASTARYLRGAGWQPGLAWGVEVRVPATFTLPARGRRAPRTITRWRAAGVTRLDGRALVATDLPATARAGLLAPAGRDGPLFLVTRNFEAIYRYNASDRYSLAVAHLADRIAGGGPITTPWPTDDGGLTRADRRELQRLLAARGHDVGAPTALLTPAILAAVRVEQQRVGHSVTGRPGQRLLGALRRP
ncbi:MAG: lytic murein transglycosylase [Gemmatimonadaceae bacterium]|nr:lytic murein transglycosylase [Gemmatimonadaceae bacterium]